MRLKRLFVIGALCAVLVFVIAESVTSSRIAYAQTHFTPYTLQVENRLFDATNNGVLLQRKTIGRRSDGAYASLETVGGKLGMRAGDQVRKVTLPTGEYFMAHDALRAVTSYRSNDYRARQLNARPLRVRAVGCVGSKEQNIGNQNIMGQETVGVAKKTTLPGLRLTEWRALGLGCESLRTVIEQQQPDGSWKVHNEIDAVSLVLGEPDPALFNLPSDYAEMKPSDIEQKEVERINEKMTPEMQKSALTRDAEYAKNH